MDYLDLFFNVDVNDVETLNKLKYLGKFCKVIRTKVSLKTDVKSPQIVITLSYSALKEKREFPFDHFMMDDVEYSSNRIIQVLYVFAQDFAARRNVILP